MISVLNDKVELWWGSIDTETLDKWIDAFPYYRMEDRETAKVPYDKAIKVDSVIRFNRIVGRAGYRLMIQDVPREDADEMCLKSVAHYCQVPEEDLKKIIDALNLYSPFRGVRYGIMGEVLHALKDQYAKRFERKDLLTRTLWYRDYDPKSNFLSSSPLQGSVEGVVHRQIGTYESGSYWGGYDDDGYDPPYLSMKFTQPLYEVAMDWIQSGWGIGESRRVLVHPSDVVEVVRYAT